MLHILEVVTALVLVMVVGLHMLDVVTVEVLVTNVVLQMLDVVTVALQLGHMSQRASGQHLITVVLLGLEPLGIKREHVGDGPYIGIYHRMPVPSTALETVKPRRLMVQLRPASCHVHAGPSHAGSNQQS